MARCDRDVSGDKGKNRRTLAEAGVVGRSMTLPEFLIKCDRSTFIALNHGMKSHSLDLVMPALTDIGLGYIQAIAVLLTAVYLEIKTGQIYWGASIKSLP